MVNLRVRSNFAVPHLLAAAQFSRQVSKIENENQGRPFGPFYEEILSFSLACVSLSVAALEAYANELFIDYHKYFQDIRSDVMKKLWELIEQKSLLEKFEFALLLRQSPMFEKGTRPYQDIDILIRLRNALIHFKPEWNDEQAVHAKISTQLQGKFAPSPFMGSGDPLFPKRWATTGCTKWAVESSVSFLHKFEELAQIEHRFDPYADRLNTE